MKSDEKEDKIKKVNQEDYETNQKEDCKEFLYERAPFCSSDGGIALLKS